MTETIDFRDRVSEQVENAHWYKVIMVADSDDGLPSLEASAADGLKNIFWYAVETSRSEKSPMSVTEIAKQVVDYAQQLSDSIGRIRGGSSLPLQSAIAKIWEDAAMILEGALTEIRQGNVSVNGGIDLGETSEPIRRACTFVLGEKQ